MLIRRWCSCWCGGSVGVGVSVGVDIGTGVGVRVGVDIGVCVGVGMGVGLRVGIGVSVDVDVFIPLRRNVMPYLLVMSETLHEVSPSLNHYLQVSHHSWRVSAAHRCLQCPPPQAGIVMVLMLTMRKKKSKPSRASTAPAPPARSVPVYAPSNDREKTGEEDEQKGQEEEQEQQQGEGDVEEEEEEELPAKDDAGVGKDDTQTEVSGGKWQRKGDYILIINTINSMVRVSIAPVLSTLLQPLLDLIDLNLIPV